MSSNLNRRNRSNYERSAQYRRGCRILTGKFSQRGFQSASRRSLKIRFRRRALCLLRVLRSLRRSEGTSNHHQVIVEERLPGTGACRRSTHLGHFVTSYATATSCAHYSSLIRRPQIRFRKLRSDLIWTLKLYRVRLLRVAHVSVVDPPQICRPAAARSKSRVRSIRIDLPPNGRAPIFPSAKVCWQSREPRARADVFGEGKFRVR